MSKAVDGQATGIMLLFCLITGLQQVAIKAVVHDVSSLLQIGLYSALPEEGLSFVQRADIALASGWLPRRGRIHHVR